jgi:hypothetical protein
MSIAIKRSFTIPSTSAIGASELYLTSSVASTSIGTGSLTIAGGAGVSGVISLGGALKLFNGSFYTGFDSAATANTTYIWPATSPSTGTSVLSSDAAGNLSWILMSASGSGLTLNGLTATTQYFSTSISGSGFTISSIGSTHTYYIGLAGNASTGLISGAAQTLFGLKTFASGVAITSGTTSTSTATGDLTTTGGVGIGGSLWTSSTNYSSISGVGLSNGVITGTLSGTATSAQILNTTTDNSSTLYILGTRSIGGFAGTSIYVNTGISALGNTITATTFSGSLSGTASSAALVNIDASTGTRYLLGTVINIASGSAQVSVGSGITIGNNLLTSGGIAVTNSTASTSTSTGSLTVVGGIGIGGSLWTSTANFSSISGVGHSNGVITSGVWSGTAISTVNGGTGLASYTIGDILYASSSTTLGKITAGTAGSILTSAGAGTTPYWSTATGSTLAIAGTNTGDIQYKSGTALGATSGFNFDSLISTFKITGYPIEAVSSSSANVKLLGGSVSWTGSINGTMLAVNTANTYTGDLLNAQIGGTSRFKVSYTGAVSIGNSFTLPVTDGTANQVLQTNGSGTVSWATVGSGTSAVTIATTSDNASTLYLIGTRSNGGFAGTALYVDTGISALGNTITATTFSGTATTAINAGFAGAATTATNAGFAGSSTNTANTNIILDTTSTIYLTGSRSNASIGSTPVYVLSGVSALGNTITATTFSGIATTSTNTANTNIVLDTTSIIYLTGSRSNTSTGSTAVYVLSGVSALGNTITATTFTGSLSGTASSAALVNVAASTGTRYLAGVSLNTATGSTQLFTGSGITIGDNRLTTGGLAVTSGTASTNTTTGALTVDGGVGVTGAVNIAGNTSISSSTSSTGFSTGALVVTGGVGIGGSAHINNTLHVTSTLASTSTTTGSFIVDGGAGIAGTLNIGADLGISGLTTLTYTSEKLNTKTSAGSAGTVTHDLSTGSVFYHSSISNNFTANFTNVPTTNDRALGVTLILAQGITPYMSTVLQIDGAAQTIKWVNNTTPTGTASKVDIVGFSLIRTGSAWTVLGQYSTYG